MLFYFFIFLFFFCIFFRIMTEDKYSQNYQEALLIISMFRRLRPEFFYFLVLGSADPNFWKSRIKIKNWVQRVLFLFFPPIT